jgi:hypothetical protein
MVTLQIWGGKKSPNVHVSAPDIGSFIIQTPKNILQNYERNPLYKPLGVSATGKQNLATGELDKHSLKFIGFVDYSNDYDEQYLNSLIEKASDSRGEIADPDEWFQGRESLPGQTCDFVFICSDTLILTTYNAIRCASFVKS